MPATYLKGGSIQTFLGKKNQRNLILPSFAGAHKGED
jgi:hypothetical protein